MNVQIKAVVGLFLCAVMPLASADFGTDFEDYARVVSVYAQMDKYNEPRQECRTETVQENSSGVIGAVIGGVAGGILGNQVGKGNGRTVATAAGAITGAVVGDRVQNKESGTAGRQVQNCRPVDNWQSRVSGYNVKYEYKGRTYSTVMPNDPGDRIRVRVSVTPM